MKPILTWRHVPHEGLGTIEQELTAARLPFSIIDLAISPPRSFEPQQLSGLIVLGGPMNVDQTAEHPFLVSEVQWLRQALDVELPILGVCLGSQLLAKALGAKVYANRVKEIGWYEVEMLPAAKDDLLFAGVDSKQAVFQWHRDTFDLPAGAVQLARSELCENQALRYGRNAWGLQFHLEVTAEIVDTWLCESGNCGELAELDYIDPHSIRRDTPVHLPSMDALGRRVFARFAQLCASR